MRCVASKSALRQRLHAAFAALALLSTALVNGPAYSKDNHEMSLNTDEDNICKKLGFDAAALKLIKATLKPEIGTVKKGGLEEPDDDFVAIRGTQQPLLPEDRELYRKIIHDFPELRPIAYPYLECDSGQFENHVIEDVNPEITRMSRVAKATRPYIPLIRQDQLDNPPRGNQKAIALLAVTKYLPPQPEVDEQGISHSVVRTVTEGFPPPGTRRFRTDQEADEFIRDMDARYAGKKLRPENLGKLSLGLRYYSNDGSQPPSDERIAQLRKDLKKLGYKIDEESCFERKLYFKSKVELEAFLHEYGLKSANAYVSEQLAHQMDVIYPVHWDRDLAEFEEAKTIVLQDPYLGLDDPNNISHMIKVLRERVERGCELSQYFELNPGTKVTKLSARRWRLDIPARWYATVIMHSATVSKI